MSDAAPGFSATELTQITARLVTHDWAWARDNAAGVADLWDRRRAARPAMFDGRVLLARDCRVEGGSCTVALFEAPFSAFLIHRDLGWPDRSVANAFAAIVPQASDGTIFLGVMAANTASAGQVYFPCGTPDLADLRADGAVDLAGSAGREFTEETGIALPAEAPPAWTLLRGEGQLVFLRPVLFREDAATLHARMEVHRTGEAEPELAGFVLARGLADIDPSRMPGFVRTYLARHFLARRFAVRPG